MTEDVKKDWQKVKDSYDAMEESESSSGSEQGMPEELELTVSHDDAEEMTSLRETIEILEKQAAENMDKFVRSKAEFENYRRLTDKDIQNARIFGISKLLESLIPVVDSLDQAIQLVNEETDTGMAEGLQLTMKLFLDVLQKQDVQQINPEGAAFDPNQHEAMTMQHVKGVPPNTILMVIQKGYILNGRVIRPARVVVSKTDK